MLYATTRSKVETYTAQRALKEDRAPDGGLYVPALMPELSHDELTELLKQPAGAIVAELLNRFFNCRLTRLDVEFAVGKRLFGLTRISHRIIIGEQWRNAEGSLAAITNRLTDLASAEMGVDSAGTWMRIVCRTAVLFAIFGEMVRKGTVAPEETVDVAVLNENFEGPFAVWYARRLGLPIGTIIICCNENSGVWDLINRGQMKMNPKVIPTNTPKCDIAVPEALELLIHSKLEWDDAGEFVRLREKGGTYYLNAEEHRHLRDGLYAAVVGGKRMRGAIPNLYRTNGYVLCPYSALVYAGLMDYRSRPGQRRAALMLSDYSPLESADTVIRALALSSDELRDWAVNG